MTAFADFVKNQPTSPQPQQGILSAVKQGLKDSVTQPYNLAKGIVTGAAKLASRIGISNPVRAVQSIPDVVQGFKDLKNNPQAAAGDVASAQAIQNAPLGGNRTSMGSTPLQNLGDAAQGLSYIAGGEFGLGMKGSGALIGTLQGAGNYVSNSTNPTLKGLALNSGISAVAGTAGGFVANKLTDVPLSSETKDTFDSRTQDATPSLNMVRKSGDLNSKVSAPLEEGNTIYRTNSGKGFFGKQSVNSSSQEVGIGEELNKIKNYPDNGTALDKNHAVQDAISSEAENLKAKLQQEDQLNLTKPKALEANKQQIQKNVMDNMNRQAREVVMTRGKGLEGDALDRAGTVQGRYAQDVAEELNKYDGTRAGILELRKNLDSIYKDARGKAAFGDNNWNALDDMHTHIRDYLNQELHDSSRSVDVKMSLQKQAKLFKAADTLDTKSYEQGISEFQTWAKTHPELYKNLKRAGWAIGIGTATGGSLYSVGKGINKAIKSQ